MTLWEPYVKSAIDEMDKQQRQRLTEHPSDLPFGDLYDEIAQDSAVQVACNLLELSPVLHGVFVHEMYRELQRRKHNQVMIG